MTARAARTARVRLIPLLAAISLSLGADRAGAQESECPNPGRLRLDGLLGERTEYARVLELRGLAPVRPHLIARPSARREVIVCAAGGLPMGEIVQDEASRSRGLLEYWVQPIGASMRFNSAYPVDRNDGAAWPGRGWTTEVDGGFGARVGPLSVGFGPKMIYQQNLAFDVVPVAIPGYGPWTYPWQLRKIDWPQRFGDEAFWTRDLGNTFVRLDVGWAAIGVSNENLWWGPARRSPLLLGNTAPGFRHVFVGTNRAVDIGVGKVTGELFWARLDESAYYDTDRLNDRRLLAGIVLGYAPSWIPGLSVGGARLYTVYPAGFDLRDYILSPYTDVRANPIGVGDPEGNNQQISIYARMAPPGSGFEAYAEWSREDHWEDMTDLLGEPDHSQAYTLGFQHVFDAPIGWLRFEGELTHLVQSITFATGRATPSFYAHPQVRQGHTHRGQLLAASTGPGSDAQFLGLDWFLPLARLGLFLERVRRETDGHFAYWTYRYGYHGHDVELTGGTRFARIWRDLELTGSLSYSRRENRLFLGLEQEEWGNFRVDRNLGLELGVRWWPW